MRVVENEEGFVKADEDGKYLWDTKEIRADMFLFNANIVLIQVASGWNAYFWINELGEATEQLMFSKEVSEAEVIEKAVNFWQKMSIRAPQIYVLLKETN